MEAVLRVQLKIEKKPTMKKAKNEEKKINIVEGPPGTMEVRISSDEELKKTIPERSNFVVNLLCDDPSDLKMIEATLKHLQIDFVLYCPCLPYNHKYDVIDNFFDRVEEEGKGTCKPILFF